LGSSHENGLGLAEAIASNDERVKVCDTGVGKGVAKDAKPDAVTLGVTESLQDLSSLEFLELCKPQFI
jgi:hypothetical protein